ncbi:type II toxin-antitoxin system mRNA interferase toxin, RelE/StbE family, partial [Patescibacteria group bacterium]|nr:type II toxin-antitoxin system mRNA interferase toxin, RelE/StbE family [Patescibacteria group bacterium]
KRLKIFLKNPSHPLIKDHKLIGSKSNLRSFSVTGDIRLIYKKISNNTIVLMDIGTHNQVY